MSMLDKVGSYGGYIGAGLNLANNLIGLSRQKKPVSFNRTEYAKRLNQIKTHGKYSPDMMGSVVNQVGNQAGNQAQMQKANMAGQMINQGMGGSIAGMRGMNEIDMNASNTISNTVRKINMENEMSKADAATEYAQAHTQYQQQARAWENQLAMGMSGAIGQGINMFGNETKYQQNLSMQQKAQTQLDEIIREKLGITGG